MVENIGRLGANGALILRRSGDREFDRFLSEFASAMGRALIKQTARIGGLRARHAALADGQSLSEEFVLADLQDARAALEEITGKRAPGDLLAHIFARFCIGK